MGKRIMICIAVAVGLLFGALLTPPGRALAQRALYTLQITDFKSRDTAVRFFGNNGPRANYINFKGGATLNTTTKALDVGTAWAMPSPTPSPAGSPGTCYAALRNEYYTVQGAPGVKDLTYQCCKSAANTYLWIAGYCQ